MIRSPRWQAIHGQGHHHEPLNAPLNSYLADSETDAHSIIVGCSLDRVEIAARQRGEVVANLKTSANRKRPRSDRKLQRLASATKTG